MTAQILAIVLAAGAGAPAGNTDNVNQKPDDAGQAIMLGFEVRPASIQVNNYIHFDEKGKVRSESHQFRLELNVHHGPAAQPISYKKLRFTRIATDDGTEIEPAGDTVELHSLRRRPGQSHFEVSVNLSQPPRTATTLAEVSGEMIVICAGKKDRVAVLPPFDRIEGKRVRIKGLSERVSVEVRKENDGEQLRIEYPKRGAPLIAKIEFTDAAGHDLDARRTSWGGTSGSNRYERYHVKMPDEGRVVLTFYRKLYDVRVPFTLRDIPLPGVGGGGKPEVVVQAVPPDQVERAATNPPGERLETEIEQ